MPMRGGDDESPAPGRIVDVYSRANTSTPWDMASRRTGMINDNPEWLDTVAALNVFPNDSSSVELYFDVPKDDGEGCVSLTMFWGSLNATPSFYGL